MSESYPPNWTHGTFHWNEETGELHVDGSSNGHTEDTILPHHQFREWVEQLRARTTAAEEIARVTQLEINTEIDRLRATIAELQARNKWLEGGLKGIARDLGAMLGKEADRGD